jgi:hypothetical protein
LLLLLLFSAVFAGPSSAKIKPLDLTIAVPIVAMIVVAFLAVTNMLATSISDPKLEAWVKTEIREFVAALILIVLIMGFFISSNGISVALTGTTDYVNQSQSILDRWEGTFDDAYAGTIMAASRIRTAATFAPYINAPLWFVSISYSTNPLAGIAILLTTLTMATQGMTNAIFLTEAIRMLIIYMKIVGPKILLPLAFIFRMIPFSRKIGNTLIALAIAGMVFLPFSVILTENLNGTIPPTIRPNPHLSMTDMMKLVPEPLSAVTTVVEPFCQSMFQRTMLGMTDPGFSAVVCIPLLFSVYTIALYYPCFEFVWNVVYPLVTEILQLVMGITLIIWEATISALDANSSTNFANRVFDVLHPFLTNINNLVLLTYLDHILIMTVTVVGARSLSSALGGEWYMAGIQRLI